MKRIKISLFFNFILVFTFKLDANVISNNGINYQFVNLYDNDTGKHLGQFVEVIEGEYSGLYNISIPSSIVHDGIEYKVIGIGDGAFAQCTNLTSINIPNDVIRIGEYAFYGCENLSNVCIPDSTVKIASGAFEDCYGLSTIIIPNCVEIGRQAFSGCENLYSVIFANPEHLKTIGYRAFYQTPWCENLPNGIVYVGNVLYMCNGNISPNEEVVVREGIEIIREEAFAYCSELSSITLPSSLRDIQFEAFRGCENLTYVEIPEGVVTIGDRCFWWCQDLSSIVIPQSIERIGSDVFYGCKNLKDVYCYARRRVEIHPEAFSADLKSTTLHVPINSFLIYHFSNKWNKFGRIVPIYSKWDILYISLLVFGIILIIGLMIIFNKSKNKHMRTIILFLTLIGLIACSGNSRGETIGIDDSGITSIMREI